MNILIIGEKSSFEECRQKFGETHFYTRKENQKAAERFMESQDVIFDFLIDEDPTQLKFYLNQKAIVFFNTAKVSLKQLGASFLGEMRWTFFGFAGLPTFLNREILETSLFKVEQKIKLEEVCRDLRTSFQIVDDRVGLVTPRVICMIINEAYFTVEEGTATREDIDLAMKLGTNYPYGPFEWCQKIGVCHVYELLEAVFKDTKDERYKICPLLKKEYLKIS